MNADRAAPRGQRPGRVKDRVPPTGEPAMVSPFDASAIGSKQGIWPPNAETWNDTGGLAGSVRDPIDLVEGIALRETDKCRDD